MARFSSLLKAKTSFVIKRLSRSESRSLGYAHWPEPPRSTAPRCFNCNTFIGEGACKCRVYVVHCLPGMLANGQKTRSYTNPKAFDDYIAAVRKLGLVVSFDSPQVARISKPTASE